MTTEALEVERLRAELSEMRVQRARERARDGWAEVERLRGVLARIEALVWYEPDDEDDLVEAVRAMARERGEARRDLGEILAVIHRDGGHNTGERGLSQSVADAHATLASVVRERDELQAKLDAELPAMWREDIASLNECLERAGRERDEARAEVERLRALLYGFTG